MGIFFYKIGVTEEGMERAKKRKRVLLSDRAQVKDEFIINP